MLNWPADSSAAGCPSGRISSRRGAEAQRRGLKRIGLGMRTPLNLGVLARIDSVRAGPQRRRWPFIKRPDFGWQKLIRLAKVFVIGSLIGFMVFTFGLMTLLKVFERPNHLQSYIFHLQQDFFGLHYNSYCLQ